MPTLPLHRQGGIAAGAVSIEDGSGARLVTSSEPQADFEAVLALHGLQLKLAEWANKRVGMPRKLTAKFGSWAAPLATALLCKRQDRLCTTFPMPCPLPPTCSLDAACRCGERGGLWIEQEYR